MTAKIDSVGLIGGSQEIYIITNHSISTENNHKYNGDFSAPASSILV